MDHGAPADDCRFHPGALRNIQGFDTHRGAGSLEQITWLGFIGHAAPFFLITWGTHFVSSGVSGLLMGAIPLFLVVLAHFFLADERLTLPKTIGFLMGFAGILGLIGPGKLLNLSVVGDALWGELAILAGGLCYAIHGITAKRLGIDNPLKQSACVCIAAAVMGLLSAVAVSPHGLFGKPQIAFWAVIGLGLLPTAFATLLMYRLMERIGPRITWCQFTQSCWARPSSASN